MDEKIENIPELRFPEFDGEWKINKIGSYISERKSTATPDLPLYSLTIENGIVPKSKRYERSFLVNNEDEAYKEMHYSDFAFNPMNLRFGALARLKKNGKVAVSKYYNIFYCNSEAEPSFFESYLTRYSMIQFYDRMSSGTLDEKKRVHFLDFIHFKKPFPSLPEQQKIASFLTAVDKKIEQLTRKKELLEQYKKGVMQKIFSQEIRFKDGNDQDYPDWEEKRLGDICATFKSGIGITSENISETGRYPVFGGNGLRGYTEKFTHDGFFALIGRQGALCGNITRIQGKAYVSEHAIVVAGNKNTDTEWLAQKLELLKLNRLSESSAQPGLAANKLKQIKILVPIFAEQKKISVFISTISTKIDLLSSQLAQTQNYKKGLLQKMFV